MKKLGIVLALFAMAAVAAIFWLRGNVDSLVKEAIEEYGSKMTKAAVKVGAVEIGAADGRGVIRRLSIGNPAGFKTAHAVKVDAIEVALDIRSLATDMVTIRKIAVTAPDVIYEKADSTTNFDAIQKNIADYIGPSKQEGGKKLVIGEFAVRDAKAHASAPFMDGKTVDVPLPDILLRDLGKSKGGATPGELGQEIAGAIKQKLSAAVSFDRLKKSVTSGLQSAGEALKGLIGR